MADGAVARWRREETRHGAVLDIVSDRACTTMLAVAFVVQRPETALPLALFLVQFCVLDTMLSLGFLHRDVDSPNDMHVVDPLLHRLNWSQPAKALDTAAVVLLVLSGVPVLASVAAIAVAAVKVWSLARMVRLLDARRGRDPPHRSAALRRVHARRAHRPVRRRRPGRAGRGGDGAARR